MCASFPGETLSRKGGCCFLMSCSPQKLFSSNDGFPRVPVTAHSWGFPCLQGQNPIHRPSRSSTVILHPVPHPPPRSRPLPCSRSLFFTVTLQPITHVATRAVFKKMSIRSHHTQPHTFAVILGGAISFPLKGYLHIFFLLLSIHRTYSSPPPGLVVYTCL